MSDKKVDLKNIVSSDGLHGPMVIHCEGWPVAKIFVAWDLTLCESVTRALYEAANSYQDNFGERPQYAFIRKLPRGVENGVEVGDLMLFEAERMLRKCVAVGWKIRPLESERK